MPRGGKRKGAGRKPNPVPIDYKSIQIPVDVYNLLIKKKGKQTWGQFLTNLIKFLKK